MKLHPTKLELTSPETLRITWSNNESSDFSVKELRDKCPCATCREKRKEDTGPVDLLPIVTTAELQPPRIVGMKPIGNYAYGIEFGDGHDTGIFTIEFFQKLAGLIEQEPSQQEKPF